jgi:hypothetical protein
MRLQEQNQINYDAANRESIRTTRLFEKWIKHRHATIAKLLPYDAYNATPQGFKRWWTNPNLLHIHAQL